MNIAVLYGGKSCEHDISVITGKMVAGALSATDRVYEIYVSQQGKWFLANSVATVAEFANEKARKKLKPVCVTADSDFVFRRRGNLLVPLFRIDCAVLCFHGKHGEDGCVQGLLELMNVPYTGCGVTASAVGMDKGLTKRVAREAGLPVLPGIEVEKTTSAVVDRLAEMGFPLIVKPVELGSSIGIGVCHTREELIRRMQTAFLFDTRLLVEPALQDFYEVNCSVLQKEGQIVASPLEKPLSHSEILTFAEKYLQGQKYEGRVFPYECDLAEEIRTGAVELYRALHCSGVVRVDFLISENRWYVNEINTIPGSLAYYLWDDMPSLLRSLVREAKETHAAKQKLTFAYTSHVLTCGGGKGKSF